MAGTISWSSEFQTFLEQTHSFKTAHLHIHVRFCIKFNGAHKPHWSPPLIPGYNPRFARHLLRLSQWQAFSEEPRSLHYWPVRVGWCFEVPLRSWRLCECSSKLLGHLEVWAPFQSHWKLEPYSLFLSLLQQCYVPSHMTLLYSYSPLLGKTYHH